MVFDGFRRSFDELLARATRPEERRVVASRMRDTLVQAKVGLGDLRDSLEKTRQRLVVEEKELETVRRRKQLAEGIGDRETVDIATKYEEMHAQRVEVVKQKVVAQEGELKAVMVGTDARPVSAPSDAELGLESDPADLRSEIDSMARARSSAEREADAARRLDELKRRMGK
jgi:hypothetical protein